MRFRLDSAFDAAPPGAAKCTGDCRRYMPGATSYTCGQCMVLFETPDAALPCCPDDVLDAWFQAGGERVKLEYLADAAGQLMSVAPASRVLEFLDSINRDEPSFCHMDRNATYRLVYFQIDDPELCVADHDQQEMIEILLDQNYVFHDEPVLLIFPDEREPVAGHGLRLAKSGHELRTCIAGLTGS